MSMKQFFFYCQASDWAFKFSKLFKGSGCLHTGQSMQEVVYKLPAHCRAAHNGSHAPQMHVYMREMCTQGTHTQAERTCNLHIEKAMGPKEFKPGTFIMQRNSTNHHPTLGSDMLMCATINANLLLITASHLWGIMSPNLILPGCIHLYRHILALIYLLPLCALKQIYCTLNWLLCNRSSTVKTWFSCQTQSKKRR